jgi:hypothetical protein
MSKTAMRKKAVELLRRNRGRHYEWWASIQDKRRRALLIELGASLEQIEAVVSRDWEALPRWARTGLKRLHKKKEEAQHQELPAAAREMWA